MIVAAAALVDETGRVLVQRRPPGDRLAGLWEFPGGKLESGESARAALVRELREELGIRVRADALRPACFWSGAVDGRELLLLLFTCGEWTNMPEPRAAAELAWCRPEALRSLPMPAPDVPLIQALVGLLERGGE